MFPADLLKAVRSCPLTVGGRQDSLVGEGAGAAFPECGESLIQAVPFHKTEYEQCIGQFPALISPFRRNHILDPGKDAKRLAVLLRFHLFEAYMEREQCHLNL